jgi:uncharacterized protein (DUF2267 family)
MEYNQLIARTQDLPFISDQDSADAAVKAAAGIVASKLDPEHAAQFVEQLPSPLSLERLRGSQERERMPETAEQAIQSLAAQLGIQPSEGEDLVQTVFSCIADEIGAEQANALCNNLPNDWQNILTIH